MRILFFNYEYPPLGGGAANATAYLLKEFSRLTGLQVDLVTAAVDNNYQLEKVGTSINIHRLPIGKNRKNLHFQSRKDLLIYTWKAFWFARNLIRQNRYDLSHSFFTVPCGFLSMVYGRLYKLPYVVSLRGADVPGYSERFSWLYKFITPLIRLIWRRAAAVVANSQGLKNLALATGTKKSIAIIYNGIDTDHFQPGLQRRPPNQFIITTGASRVTHRKGLNYLIEAAAKLSKNYPNIQVKIMGDGNAKAELEKFVQQLGVSDRVKFLGRIPREETARYYQEASLFVLPSLNEGMSNAMLEALATGLPIISTSTGGAQELVKDGTNGYLVQFKDSEDLSEKMEKIISDDRLAKNMGAASRQLAETLSWKKVAAAYHNLYAKVANE